MNFTMLHTLPSDGKMRGERDFNQIDRRKTHWMIISVDFSLQLLHGINRSNLFNKNSSNGTSSNYNISSTSSFIKISHNKNTLNQKVFNSNHSFSFTHKIF